MLITLCLFLLLVLRFKGIEYGGIYFSDDFISVYSYYTKNLLLKIYIYRFFYIRYFLIFRLSQGIKEPGLFMEFNLEGILWVSLALYIFKRITVKFWGKFVSNFLSIVLNING